MAKLKSLIKIEGTLEELTFYKTQDGYMVRTKGGVSKNRIKNDPAFARTRENGTEFGLTAKSGKYLRRAITSLLADAKDNRMSSRLTQVFSQVKNEDLISVRGQRNVPVGLETETGKALLKGFDFNKFATLDSVLQAEYNLNSTTGEVIITDIVLNQQLGVPEGATHVSFSCAFLNLDLNTNVKDLQLSPVENFPINGTATTVTLTPSTAAIGSGFSFYFLKVSFYQEVNNIQYPINNGAYNALQLIEIL
ncbi:hypothetical protein [Formosa haliotis]|uniref:hypothetical protein n=1 Tax=Formosa haliotis TaxID=1555194 RepID=UPI000826F7D3|nr:hypothetical protein [Formosa haliotis]